jgi:hypothetical protein
LKNVFLILAIIIFGVGVIYAIKNPSQIARRLKNENLQTSQSSDSAPVVNMATVDEAVKEYLPVKIIIADPGARVFCSHHIYGFDDDINSNQISAYVWAYCEEYFLKDERVTMGQGVSYPIKINLKIQNSKLIAVNHEEPVDGSGYGASIEKMFPEDFAKEAIRGYDIAKFNPSPEEQAKTFYGK